MLRVELEALREDDFNVDLLGFATFLIWAKNTFTMGRSDYQRQYEPVHPAF
jgi:hypothetical protein